MTQTPTLDGTDSPEDSPVVTFRPRLLSDDSTPPNPVEADTHYEYSMVKSDNRPGELLSVVTENSIRIADAAKAGWIVYYPQEIEVTNQEGDIAFTSGDEILSATELNNNVYKLDTKWSVQIPPGTVLRSYSPFAHVSTALEIVSSVVARTPSEITNEEPVQFVPIRPSVRVTGSGKLSTKIPCTQLVLTEDVTPHVDHDPLSSDLQQEVDKQDRAERLYGDWYQQLNASDER